jgi:hypothetical protein
LRAGRWVEGGRAEGNSEGEREREARIPRRDIGKMEDTGKARREEGMI